MVRALVAYESLTQTTKEIAEEIGRVLAAEGIGVSVSHVGDVGDATLYDFVVLGAPIRGGRWVRGARSFLVLHAEELPDRPLALFAVGGTLRPDSVNPDVEQTTRRAIDEVIRRFPRLDVVDVQLFAGRIDRERLPRILRWIARLVRLPEGDWRDWDAIRRWARVLAPRIKGSVERGAGVEVANGADARCIEQVSHPG